MKKFYFLIVALCVVSIAKAQIINFPDANFKAKLLQPNSAVDLNDNYFSVDINQDGEIDVYEASQVKKLMYYGTYADEGEEITDISGINNFVNLEMLLCFANEITTLEISNLTNLRILDCSFQNQGNVTFNLVLNNLPNLINLNFSENFITSINLEGTPNLEDLQCFNSALESLDVSNLLNLNGLDCSGTTQLESLFINNGNPNLMLGLGFNNNLRYICANENQLAMVEQAMLDANLTNCTVNPYCSFVPGGTYYVINGKAIVDFDDDGCEITDPTFPNVNMTISNGISTGYLVSDNSGSFSLPLTEGTYTITPIFENMDYINVSPASINVSFPSQPSPFTQDFCITYNGSKPDLEVVMASIVPARPGFDAKYKLIYKNKGTIIQNGTLNLSFDDTVLDLVSALPVVTNQITNNLSWDFVNLQPFETREIALTFNVNSPMETPAVNGGDILNYTTTITSAAVEETPADNTFTLNQTVVNSYDPNDKTCLEGTTIAPSEVGKYVHYVIRFENTGTYPAENIVVKDMIDTTKFDVSTLVPMKGSHDFYTRINGNKVEFIFENINLPFDDANNDGYVAFKIKTKPTLVNGDTFSNSANIYFDYNFPIVTNTATTTIQALSTQDFEFGQYFNVYPNPVNTVLNIDTKQTIEVSSISIYNQLGQLVVVVPSAQNVKTVDVSNLSAGNYFIKINSDKGTSNAKFIKR